MRRARPVRPSTASSRKAKRYGDLQGQAALDAGLVAAAQAVEHYEISRYGTLSAWARALGMKDAAMLFAKTLDDETRTDESLSKLAKVQLTWQPSKLQ